MSGRIAWRGGTPVDLAIVGARVVDPREDLDTVADVIVSGGRIEAVGEGIAAASEGNRIEARGMLLMPAFTDPHVHFRTPGQEHKETLATGTRAAAAGGYCQVLAMPNTDPVVDSPEILEGLLARADREAVIPFGQLGAVTRGLGGSELTEMDSMAAVGAFGFTDDGLPVTDAGVLRRALRHQAIVGLTIALHEEDPSLSVGASINEGEVSARLGLRGGTGLSESTMVTRDCALAEAEGARIHLQHLSDARSVEAVRQAKERGIAVTAEASPHHLLLTEDACCDLDTATKMNPPLRFERDRLALVDGLRDGTIDCVATDHAPHSVGEKERPFEEAPFGITGLETAFAVLHEELVADGTIGLSALVERMTAGCVPFGLDAPRITPGRPADLVLFDPASEWVPGEGGWESKSSNSPFAGRRTTGRVVLTIAAGVEVFRGERIAL